ncbi:type VII secretion protein EccB [Catellatospora paridis]|uniref:type VII secretion protein EccB n=1 Tax=Catellatospora paridis TaxID=1617086 RepID=UPI0018AFE672|nr:type VII secretion protein EccB [Catellatospora paridis]
MQTKRDQLQAHNFVVGRLRSALLTGEPDALETPTRRFSVGAFAGLIIGALIVAGCGAYGFFFPGGSTSWREPGTIVVEKETGTAYVYDSTAGVLRPVRNRASALLLTGPDSVVRSVSVKSLEGVPHGLPVGITGAPDSLPATARLSRDPWLVCATSAPEVTGQSRPTVLLAIGAPADVAATPVDRAMLVAIPDGTRYLIWGNRRMRVADPAASVALALDGVRPTPVADTWLNGFPAGPDLAPPPVADVGAAGPPVDGKPTRIGQVLRVSGADDDSAGFRLVLADGLASLTPTMAELILADPRSRAAYDGSPRAVPVSSAGVVSAPVAARPIGDGGLPARPPLLLDPNELGDQVPCARATFGADASLALVTARVGHLRAATPPPGAVDQRSATLVAVAAGAGVLVRPETAPGRPGSARWLITDVGVRYPLSDAAVPALGYGGVVAVDVPATLLALVPSGPVLDPVAAAAG